MATPSDRLDRAILAFDRGLRTLFGMARANRDNPAAEVADADLAEADRRHAAGLMRINHTGEVCAQALYEGQALVARRHEVRDWLQHAAAEETDHLAWCAERLRELGSRPSVLNPVFYGASMGLGVVTGLLGDRVSLGFVEATEDQVGEHLTDHLERLPPEDQRSRAIVAAMREEELRHGRGALAQGGEAFPSPVRKLMRLVSKVMTETTYRF
jgi:ubiquinone biosynthesis monooxygenase Coq7